MIHALNTRDVSDHERRQIARQIRDGQDKILECDDRVVLARDVNEGVNEGEEYHCIYCMENVYMIYGVKNRVRFQHLKNEGCMGSEKGLPGIENPPNVTMPGPS